MDKGKRDEIDFKERQYVRLIEARKYQYDVFHRWLTFFYVFIGALFVAYYTIVARDNTYTLLEYIILGVGYVVSLCTLLSCRGASYWWSHWNQCLIAYERDVLGLGKGDKELLSIFGNFADIMGLDAGCPTKSANISTARVIMLMLFTITNAWGFVLGTKAMGDFLSLCSCQCKGCCIKTVCVVFAGILSIAVTYVLVHILSKRYRSHMDNHNDLHLLQKK